MDKAPLHSPCKGNGEWSPQSPAGPRTNKQETPPSRRALLLLVSATALSLAGCADESSNTREELVTTFEDKGWSPEMARCMADGLIAEFGTEAVEGSRAMTDEEKEAYTFILDQCVTDVGIENVGSGLATEGMDCSGLEGDERTRCEELSGELDSEAPDFLDPEVELDPGLEATVTTPAAGPTSAPISPPSG